MPRQDADEYDTLYGGSDRPPWEIDEAQPALAAVVERGVAADRVLDLGCGSGELTMLLASKGCRATGVDFSVAAIELARRKAAERGLAVDFQVGDALALPDELGGFDAVFDSGLLHSLLETEQETYVATLRRVCAAGGTVQLLAIAADAQSGWGLTRDRLEQLFADGFTDLAIEPITVAARSVSLDGWLLRATR